ncbi:MAG: 3-oxoacyl-ACP synthase III, partial [Pirellulaceae bacterium]
MQFQRVRLASIGYTIPPEVVHSDQIEQQLAPLYKRLELPPGRLELMTGIQERRQWPRGTMPSDRSAESCRHALQAAGISGPQIDLLVHGSVCRDYLEPATACRVHHLLGLAADCLTYDVSNACLGLLNGMIQAAAMIDTGQVRSALVVGTEVSRYLMETTIESLNCDTSL